MSYTYQNQWNQSYGDNNFNYELENEYQRLKDQVRRNYIASADDLSKFITSHDLTKLYPKLTKAMRFRNYLTQKISNIKGGIPHGYFLRLCHELGLKTRNSKAEIM